ncbi:ribosomal protein S6 kinase-related protein [Perca flavescens]|uniref:ribosomal protein S6 kinase-related protein n=1 Tax=Perca flavescens TaxID=8167 RepID=UPI00106DEB27|nr:ribosomal protein S6 kinase-related protein [Perca flavescens]
MEPVLNPSGPHMSLLAGSELPPDITSSGRVQFSHHPYKAAVVPDATPLSLQPACLTPGCGIHNTEGGSSSSASTQSWVPLRHGGAPSHTDWDTQRCILGLWDRRAERPSPHSCCLQRTQRRLIQLPSVFLPEFPQRGLPGRDHFQILGFIAKGSYGPILKVKDITKEKTYAVKVLPKSDILKHGVLEQSKEEVIIQRQIKHPFIHNLQDCWQTQHHLFIMCDYCSTGDLYTYWLLKGRFGEDVVRLFAAELGSALGFLHDVGIIHRDVKMDNIVLSDQGHLRLSDFGLSRRLKRGGRAFTICGTIQYMAPEVLSGGPYNHAAHWWSFGIMLFSLVTGEFPVPAELDHSTMLNTVTEFPYVLP